MFVVVAKLRGQWTHETFTSFSDAQWRSHALRREGAEVSVQDREEERPPTDYDVRLIKAQALGRCVECISPKRTRRPEPGRLKCEACYQRHNKRLTKRKQREHAG